MISKIKLQMPRIPLFSIVVSCFVPSVLYNEKLVACLRVPRSSRVNALVDSLRVVEYSCSSLLPPLRLPGDECAQCLRC